MKFQTVMTRVDVSKEQLKVTIIFKTPVHVRAEAFTIRIWLALLADGFQIGT